VVVHHALADRRISLAHSRAHGGDDAAGLVTADDRAATAAEPERLRGIAGGAIRVQIAPAHARGLDGDDGLAGPRRGIGELAQL
jgi:hypothetical protein